MKKTLVATLILGAFAAPALAGSIAHPHSGIAPSATKKSDGVEIGQRVVKIVSKQLGINETKIKKGSLFVKDLGADSLDSVEMVMAMEEEFGIAIPDADAEKMASVQQAIDYVLAHTKN